MKITEKELLKRADAVFRTTAMAQEYGGCDRASLEAGYRAAARALGYELVEGPALPERVAIDDSGCVYDEANNKALIATSDVWSAWLREAVLRYNAKAAVMKVARALESRDATVRDAVNAAYNLRAAYEEKP